MTVKYYFDELEVRKNICNIFKNAPLLIVENKVMRLLFFF